MAFWRARRCWIPCVTRCPPDNRISVFSEITPDLLSIPWCRGLRKCRPASAGGHRLRRRFRQWTQRKLSLVQPAGSINIETCVAIPTTSGTGSEVTSACVISDPEKGIKYPMFNNALYPDMAILDPTLVVSVPPQITANTGMDGR